MKLGLAAQWIRPEAGVFDVVVHADGDRLLILESGAWRELSPGRTTRPASMLAKWPGKNGLYFSVLNWT